MSARAGMRLRAATASVATSSGAATPGPAELTMTRIHANLIASTATVSPVTVSPATASAFLRRPLAHPPSTTFGRIILPGSAVDNVDVSAQVLPQQGDGEASGRLCRRRRGRGPRQHD